MVHGVNDVNAIYFNLEGLLLLETKHFGTNIPRILKQLGLLCNLISSKV